MVSSTEPTAAERPEVLQRAHEMLQSQRRRIHDFLQGNASRLSELEARWTAELAVMEQQCDSWLSFQDALAQRDQSLQQQAGELDARQAELATKEGAVEQMQQKTKEQRRRAAIKLDQRRRQCLAEQTDQSQFLQCRILELEQQMAEAQNAHAETLADCQRNRDQVAGQLQLIEGLRQQLAESQSAQADSSRSQQAITELQQTIDDLRRELATAQAAQADSSRSQQMVTDQQKTIDDLRKQLATAQAAQANSSRSQQTVTDQQKTIDDLRQQLAAAQANLADSQVNQDALAGQLRTIDELQKSIVRLNAQLRDMNETASQDRQALTDMQMRYEMAMESVESLREKNDRLEEDVARLESSASSAASGPRSQADNWEATKRRMLANLDSDEGGQDDLSPQATISYSDDELAAKDREIEYLREQLAAQTMSSSNVDSHDADARESILAADDIIASERAKLAELQAELHEKLRSSEIECAKERAQNTRLRSELQEKLRDVEIELARARGNAGAPGKAKSTGRRWLDHLGLHPDSK